MPPWITIWIARLAFGEQLRKARPADYRSWFGFFALLPICVALGVNSGHSFLNKAGPVAILLALSASLIIFFAVSYFWARLVPAMVSLVLGIIVWAVGFWMAWHDRL